MDIGFGSEETNYPMKKRMSEPFDDPKNEMSRIHKHHKKAKQNSSELAGHRPLPTARFGLNEKQEAESYATPVVDSQPEVEDRKAQAAREIKRKLNPFIEDRKASATQENVPNGVVLSDRMHGLARPKLLSLERFVALIMSHPREILDPNLSKIDIHPSLTSINSDTYNYGCQQLTPANCGCQSSAPVLRACGSVKRDAGRARPRSTWGIPSPLQASVMHEERESVTHRFD